MWSHQSTNNRTGPATRALTPIVASLLLIALTIGTVTMAAVALSEVVSTPGVQSPTATVDLTVDDDTLRFTHTYGDPLDVRTLSVRISVDGEPLDEQPPVPFFSATGFVSGPTGPFNIASDGEWTVGETASLTVASTNSPTLEPGSTVSVRISTADRLIAHIETRS